MITYLSDASNPTDYAQVLEEYVAAILDRSYTPGHDVLSQRGGAGSPALHLLPDAHGSTRLLADLSTTIATLAQRYAYDAYGLMLDHASLTTAATALTRLLYSGEWTQTNGQQYLRARFYDPASGRFTTLDPYAGNPNDPLSLHKYLYTHANPVMGIDPSGEFTLIENLISVSQTVSNYGLKAYNICSKSKRAKQSVEVFAIVSSITAGFLFPQVVGNVLTFRFNLSNANIFDRFKSGGRWPDIFLALSRTKQHAPVVQVRADWKSGVRLRLNITPTDLSQSSASAGPNANIRADYPKLDLAFRYAPPSQLKSALIISWDTGLLWTKEIKFAYPLLVWDVSKGTSGFSVPAMSIITGQTPATNVFDYF